MNSVQSITCNILRCSLNKSLREVSKQHAKNLSQSSSSVQTVEVSNSSSQNIVIPKKIERGPTDILRALASTVKRDYTAPDYKFHDDPFLIPMSNPTKRTYALAQESGRKAAHWIRQEHADLFQHKVADPPIEAYFPRAVYDDTSEVDEGVLQQLIAQQLVSDSVTVYGLLEQKGAEVSRDTKQSLLELICYYNCQESLEEEWIEERWFKQESKGKQNKLNTWKNGGAAEKLFQSISPPDASSYSALICGMAQFGNMAGAYKLYQEAADAGLKMPVQVFSKIIAGANVLKEGHELRWQFIEEMLETMRQQGVPPNLGTLNAILETISLMSTHRDSQKWALGIIAEFRNMGIKPSLGSYYFLLNIFCKERSNIRSNILVSILNILDGKSFAIQDPKDCYFFTAAMENCRFYLADVEQAYRLDRLLHTADNYNLIGDSYKESVYYRNFFALVCEMGTLEEFMVLYNKLVPNVYVPEPGLMETIIKAVDLNEASHLLPKMWSDLVMFDQSHRESSVCAVLTALQRSHSDDRALLDQHADVAWAIYCKVESQKEEVHDRFKEKISWTGPMMGDIIQVLLRADRYDQAVQVIKLLDRIQHEVLGVLTIESLKAFLEKTIERKEIKNAIWCIQYCSDSGFEETISLAQKLSGAVELSDNEKATLANIVGQDALKNQAVSSS